MSGETAVPRAGDSTGARTVRFAGRIAGFGTASGTRIVAGLWQRSPFGPFADVMLEDAGGHRTLLAPSDEVAEFVSSTYSFDEVRVVPVAWHRITGGLRVEASGLEARLFVGAMPPLGRLLRVVPPRIATAPLWLEAIDPLARVIVPGVRTAGTAGGGRREFYGVTTLRRIAWAGARLDGVDLGAFAALDPPVRFGFGSAPPEPHLVDLVTSIRMPAAG
ncbi:hypothetical protein N1028_15540 [Herbiconiux sp. CPCC 203407]|uniref:Uncharacterized protein n=1 Tax=Herbiconiux oxytropis TaxID=2970915 RepID=A0AA41XJK7_9MICO|nr:hypothetical protein [Herbiconiux oxytropis]MCS5724217.1 hypothetical protein [Herbiconiux oxytropis]MCS5727308.1 hypothetical protein [Herbiconiux oxytropis]